MTKQVFNFGAGPAMLPVPVMQQIQQEFLNFQGMGISLIELSHRSKEFEAVIDGCDALIRELSNLPDNYKILYTHGGAQMQFAGVPLNLLGLKPAHKAVYSETGNFSKLANKEAARYGEIRDAERPWPGRHSRRYRTRRPDRSCPGKNTFITGLRGI